MPKSVQEAVKSAQDTVEMEKIRQHMFDGKKEIRNEAISHLHLSKSWLITNILGWHFFYMKVEWKDF